jgi:lipopolysaccharide/colanic/teichoic acid biosynthesis glycosyltransferase
MTSWWQNQGAATGRASAYRNSLYYIQRYSLFLDAFILLKTVMVVIQGKGAF